MTQKARSRAAIVAGIRTPFVKRRTHYSDLSALDLGKRCVAELVDRTGLDPRALDQLVYGQVTPGSTAAPNIARDIVIGAGLPRQIEAYTVSRACATGYQAVADVARAIEAGTIRSGIAGGADSASDVPIRVSKALAEALTQAAEADSLGERLEAFVGLKARDLRPIPPALSEPSTGITMGQAAEKMAKENGIDRRAQDQFAHQSHRRADAAWRAGKLDDEVMTMRLPPDYAPGLHRDPLVRQDSDPDAYAKLEPAFDRRHGTVTAGNSSPLTDGASAVLLMNHDHARASGFDVLGFIRSCVFLAVDPRKQMLIGPALAIPQALEQAGLELSDVDLLDLHEAFAAQILSVTQALESDHFARTELGRDRRVGTVDWDRFNVNGGSIAVGHPFAATGGRQIVQTLRELKRRGANLAVCSACAAGGLAVAMVLEVEA